MPTECWHMQEGHREAFMSHIKHHHRVTTYYHTLYNLPWAWQNNQIHWIKTIFFIELAKLTSQAQSSVMAIFFPIYYSIHHILNGCKSSVFYLLTSAKITQVKKRVEQSRSRAGVMKSRTQGPHEFITAIASCYHPESHHSATGNDALIVQFIP